MAIDGVTLNGPTLSPPEWRLAGNLNVSFAGVDGEALLMQARRSRKLWQCLHFGEPRTQPMCCGRWVLARMRSAAALRFGLGRFNTAADVELAIEVVAKAVARLRSLVAAPQPE